MRCLALLLLLSAACGPKVQLLSPYEEDDARAGRAPEPAPTPPVPAVPEAPPGDGLRTDTIDRARLREALAAGPGDFLTQLEVTAAMDGERFVGWQLVQLLDAGSPLAAYDLRAGDVLLSLNGATLSKPDDLMDVWQRLGDASAIEAVLARGAAQFRIVVTIVDAPAA